MMAKPLLKHLTDEEVLLALLQNPSKLDTFEKRVFEEWLGLAEKGRQLSDKQRAMARRKFEVLDLISTFDRDNLASVTKVTGAKMAIRSGGELESVLGPKPLAPPRRKLDI
jgi:hypothetical protein